MVETICDPDYINQTVLAYFQTRDASQEEQTRAYAYAATYEEFIKVINDCKSVSVLRQIRSETSVLAFRFECAFDFSCLFLDTAL